MNSVSTEESLFLHSPRMGVRNLAVTIETVAPTVVSDSLQRGSAERERRGCCVAGAVGLAAPGIKIQISLLSVALEPRVF